MPFEVVATNSSYFDGEYLSSAANVLKTDLNIQFWLRQAFSNSIYPHINGKIR